MLTDWDATAREWRKTMEEQAAAITQRDAVIRELVEALTPSRETKAAYIGEFSFTIPDVDEDGEEYQRNVNVPWTTIKEIMKAIGERAALARAKEMVG